MDKEYEILPADELAKLRHEVELLKAHPFGNSQSGKTLQESVENLTSAINRLIKVFSDVEQDMIDEYEDQKTVNQHLHDINEQNQKIASGIVALADRLDVSKVPQEKKEQPFIDTPHSSSPQTNNTPLRPPSGQFPSPNNSEQNPFANRPAPKSFNEPPSLSNPPLNDPFSLPREDKGFMPPRNTQIKTPPMPPPKKKRFGLFR